MEPAPPTDLKNFTLVLWQCLSFWRPGFHWLPIGFHDKKFHAPPMPILDRLIIWQKPSILFLLSQLEIKDLICCIIGGSCSGFWVSINYVPNFLRHNENAHAILQRVMIIVSPQLLKKIWPTSCLRCFFNLMRCSVSKTAYLSSFSALIRQNQSNSIFYYICFEGFRVFEGMKILLILRFLRDFTIITTF